jgi:uncharacterized membrane protein
MPEIIPNLHPFFVHFTISLITISFLSLLSAKIIKFFHFTKFHKELLIVSKWCLWLGSLAVICTVGAGFYAYYSVNSHSMNSHMAMLTHRTWALITFTVIIVMSLWSLILQWYKRPPKLLYTLGLFFAFLGVMITGFYGSELVYRYGLGVIPASTLEAVSHSHEEGNHNRRKMKTEPHSENTEHSHE